MGRVRSAMVGLLALLTLGAAPPTGDERVLDIAAPYVTVTVNGQPMRLRVEYDVPTSTIRLNPAAVERAHLRPTTVQTATEPVKIVVSSAMINVDIEERTRLLKVQWSGGDAGGADADGIINPQSLPESRVTMRLRAPSLGERQIELPTVTDPDLAHPLRLGGVTVSVLFAPEIPYTIATAAAGAHLAKMAEGHWSGPPISIPFYWAGARPGRVMALARPLSLNGLTVRSFLVATADFRGAYMLPSDPEPEDGALVVTGKAPKGTAMLTLVLGRDALAGCSSITHDKKRRMVVLQCADGIGTTPALSSGDLVLVVSSEGKVVRCTIEQPGQSPAADKEACALLEQKANFRPVSDGGGKAVTSVYHGAVRWAQPGLDGIFAPLVDMVVTLQAMPQTLTNPVFVDLAISVDDAGRVEGCAFRETADPAGQPFSVTTAATRALGNVACGEALKALKPAAAQTAEGMAVRSVQIARVAFTAPAAP